MRDHEHARVVRRGGTTKTMNAAALVTAQKAAAAPLLAALVYVGVDGTYPQHQHFVAVFIAVTGFAVAWATYTACMDSREPWAVVARGDAALAGSLNRTGWCRGGERREHWFHPTVRLLMGVYPVDLETLRCGELFVLTWVRSGVRRSRSLGAM